MLNAVRSRAGLGVMGGDEGFTLVEQMLVVGIIGVLLAIGIPTLLGAKSRANDRAVQSSLRTGMVTEKTYFSDQNRYSNDVAPGGQLKKVEQSLTYLAGPVPATGAMPMAVYVEVTSSSAATNDIVCLTGRSASGGFFGMRDAANGAGGTKFSKGSTPPPAGCDAADYTLSSF